MVLNLKSKAKVDRHEHFFSPKIQRSEERCVTARCYDEGGRHWPIFWTVSPYIVLKMLQYVLVTFGLYSCSPWNEIRLHHTTTRKNEYDLDLLNFRLSHSHTLNFHLQL